MFPCRHLNRNSFFGLSYKKFPVLLFRNVPGVLCNLSSNAGIFCPTHEAFNGGESTIVQNTGKVSCLEFPLTPAERRIFTSEKKAIC